MRIIILGVFENELSDIIQLFDGLKEIVLAKRRCWITKQDGHDILISFAGIGTTSASATTTALCEQFEPDAIVLCGVAGGFDPDHQIGDLVLGTKIIDADLCQLRSLLQHTPYDACLTDPHTSKPFSYEYKPHPMLLEIGNKLSIERLKQGTIVTSNIFPAPKSLFAQIKSFNCNAIEMESVGVCKAAEYYDVPVITIRAISNRLDNEGNDLGTEPDALTICSKRLALCLVNFLTHIHLLEEEVAIRHERCINEMISN